MGFSKRVVLVISILCFILGFATHQVTQENTATLLKKVAEQQHRAVPHSKPAMVKPKEPIKPVSTGSGEVILLKPAD